MEINTTGQRGIGLRHIALAAAAFLLVACSSNPHGDALTKRVFQRGEFTPDPAFLALQERGAPTWVASLQKEDRPITLFSRKAVNAKGEETWISPDSLSLGMINGMIIASRGFGGDLMSSDSTQTRAALAEGREGVVERFAAVLDGETQTQLLAFRCRITRSISEPVVLSESYTASTDLFLEECRNGDLSFRNLFWVERSSRRIVQSRQWLSEAVEPLALRLVKI